jgi:hypothetical protein
MTEKRSRGRPRKIVPGELVVDAKLHSPTNENREKVEILRAWGKEDSEIAAALGISVEVLLKYYHTELDNGLERRQAEVIIASYKAALKGNVASLNRWLEHLASQSLPDKLDTPDGPAKPAKIGKKEEVAAMARETGVGRYATPEPPKLSLVK